jgi:anaerobic ribonucleoside-triphosphate reductase activating protein
MPEITWLLDTATGVLTVEGLSRREAGEMAAGLLPSAEAVNCARPLNVPPLRGADTVGLAQSANEPSLQVFRIYHGSVTEGPGRRSVVQFSGCPHQCPSCFVPRTHGREAGARLPLSEVLARLLGPAGAPRDGVTVTGGEPFQQPAGLAALLRGLKMSGQHITLYTGYTVEALCARRDSHVTAALGLADIIIDGLFVAAQAENAGEWRGSRNQRIWRREELWNELQRREKPTATE